MALLLPKLRSYFAEFLNEGYLARLSILYLPTCVGFSTDTSFLLRGFSRQCGVNCFTLMGSASYLRINKKTDLPIFSPYILTPQSNKRPTYPTVSPHRQTKIGSTGILTCCPSTTPFGLILGPTYPERTNLAQETLGYQRIRFSLIFSLLVPTFSLLSRPPILTN